MWRVVKVQDQSINELLSQSLAQSIIHLQARAHRWPMLALFIICSHTLEAWLKERCSYENMDRPTMRRDKMLSIFL